MSDYAEQTDEILALKSIYGDKSISCDTESKPLQGRIVVDVDAAQVFEEGNFKVCLDNNPETLVTFKHLNPITLTFQLPHDYPSKSPPSYSLYIYWLSHKQVSTLTSHLESLWQEQSNSVILFTWFNFLKNEALKLLKIHSAIPLPQNKIIKLSEYNAVKEDEEFNESIQLCPVCFIDKAGKQCKRLINCGHIFCNTCLTDFLQMAITEGGVATIRCMENDCTSEINPANVKELVSEELYNRYERLLLQNSLDEMSDVVYCPREDCKSAVIIDREHSLGSCQVCSLSFCTYCRCTYHGFEKCKFQTGDKKMYDLFMANSEEEKEEMRKKYGRRRILDMVESFQSLQWIQKSTVKCPRCKRPIEKTDGCNKMTCSSCKTYFCWICGGLLNRANPYAHYSIKGTKCYNNLFLGMDVDALDNLVYDMFD